MFEKLLFYAFQYSYKSQTIYAEIEAIKMLKYQGDSFASKGQLGN